MPIESLGAMPSGGLGYRAGKSDTSHFGAPRPFSVKITKLKAPCPVRGAARQLAARKGSRRRNYDAPERLAAGKINLREFNELLRLDSQLPVSRVPVLTRIDDLEIQISFTILRFVASESLRAASS